MSFSEPTLLASCSLCHQKITPILVRVVVTSDVEVYLQQCLAVLRQVQQHHCAAP